MYRVVRAFVDLTDDNRLYKVGDTYPVDGVKVDKKRVGELIKGSNKNGKVYIEEVKTSEGESKE